MTDDQYQRLRRAVAAYAKALQAYGLMVGPDGSNQWIDSDQLDELWTAVMLAADLPIPQSDNRRGRES